MGNLMFEYVLVVSLCSLSGVDFKKCARFTESASQRQREDLPLAVLGGAIDRLSNVKRGKNNQQQRVPSAKTTMPPSSSICETVYY